MGRKNLLPRITDEHYMGLIKLMAWCIKKHQESTSLNGKRLWKDRINFLSELRWGQFYSTEQKVIYNKIRESYYWHKQNNK